MPLRQHDTFCDNFYSTLKLSRSTRVIDLNRFDVVSEIDKLEHLLSRAVRPSYYTAIKPVAEGFPTIDAWNEVFEEPEPPRRATDSVIHLETVIRIRSMNAGSAAVREVVNQGVKR